MTPRLKHCLSTFIYLLAFVAYSQHTGDTFTDTYIIYEVTAINPNTVKVTNYNTNGGTSVIIPKMVDYGSNTYMVTAIDNHAFRDNQLTRVTFESPSNVTSIGDLAFFRNSLTIVEIPDGVTSIGRSAFEHNKLTSVTIPNSVTSIDDNVFAGNQLESVIIPTSVTSIGHRAFAYNPQLTNVLTLGNTPPSLVDTAFQMRRNINLKVPEGKVEDYRNAGWVGFNYIVEIGEIGYTFSSNHITYEIVSINPKIIWAIGYTHGDSSISIPQTVILDSNSYTVTRIDDSAFSNKQLTHVTLPNSLESIGAGAFAHNPGLVLLKVKTNNPPTLAANVFIVYVNFLYHTNRNEIDLIVPVNALGAYQDPNNGWTGFKSIEETDDAIGDIFTANHIAYRVASTTPNTVVAAGYNTDGGSSVSIPQTVNYQGADYTLTAIENNAFRDNQLTSVQIPDGVTSIGINTFLNNQLASVIIPNSVTSIGAGAFRDNQLSSVELSDGLTSIGGGTFYNNQLTSVTIPNGVESIGGSAFYNNQLTSVEIPNSVTTIGNWAFSANQLEHVTIPDSVTSIEESAFQDNPDLGLITVKANTPAILHTDAFVNADRNQIDLVVPLDALEEYKDWTKDWTGFKSIRGEVSLSLNENNDLKDFKIYPNPAHDIINIELHDGQELEQVNIYNVLGRHLYTGSTSHIDVSRLSSGMYLLEVTTKTEERAVKRIIIE